MAKLLQAGIYKIQIETALCKSQFILTMFPSGFFIFMNESIFTLYFKITHTFFCWGGEAVIEKLRALNFITISLSFSIFIPCVILVQQIEMCASIFVASHVTDT